MVSKRGLADATTAGGGRVRPDGRSDHDKDDGSNSDGDGHDGYAQGPPAKRQRVSSPSPRASENSRHGRAQQDDDDDDGGGSDFLTRLSDELLLRVLSYLSSGQLLGVAPASHRFYRLAADSQLWKALYYERFVLPRAMRIPGFRDGYLAGTRQGPGPGRRGIPGPGRNHTLHYTGRHRLWADGRRGGVVRRDDAGTRRAEQQQKQDDDDDDDDYDGDDGPSPRVTVPRLSGAEAVEAEAHESIDWKRQYKVRHNWARGKCAVEELRIGSTSGKSHNNHNNTGPRGADDDDDDDNHLGTGHKVLVKVVDGIAITADRTLGLRAWDLKTRQILAHISLGHHHRHHRHHRRHDGHDTAPATMAIDDQGLDQRSLHIAIGFVDGSFGVWSLDLRHNRLVRRYRHEKSSNGALVGIAYSSPYLLTATDSVLISLYTFEAPAKADGDDDDDDDDDVVYAADGEKPGAKEEDQAASPPPLPAPYLLTSLNSYTSRPPLALSIRKTASITIASIAYTFSTRRGWSIGIQDLHIKASPKKRLDDSAPPEIIATQLAYTDSVDAASASSHPLTPPRTPARRLRAAPPSSYPSPPMPMPTPSPPAPLSSGPSPAWSSSPPSPRPHAAGRSSPEPGPTTLCYTHPYLLATLPDNTLILYLCTSSASSLAISPGIRLWGHTSGISDAEITSRGRAVSVSSRGEEMRVWELEGRPSSLSGSGSSRSVEIRPAAAAAAAAAGAGNNRPPGLPTTPPAAAAAAQDAPAEWEKDRRNWVGFDDEMVIVLKESRGGQESLMVYDFT